MSKWIRIQDRFPESDGEVLTYSAHKDFPGVGEYAITYFIDGCWDLPRVRVRVEEADITHWQPLSIPEDSL